MKWMKAHLFYALLWIWILWHCYGLVQRTPGCKIQRPRWGIGIRLLVLLRPDVEVKRSIRILVARWRQRLAAESEAGAGAGSWARQSRAGEWAEWRRAGRVRRAWGIQVPGRSGESQRQESGQECCRQIETRVNRKLQQVKIFKELEHDWQSNWVYNLAECGSWDQVFEAEQDDDNGWHLLTWLHTIKHIEREREMVGVRGCQLSRGRGPDRHVTWTVNDCYCNTCSSLFSLSKY